MIGYLLLHDLAGGTLLVHEPLDSYTLQALAWRNGEVCLTNGQDYPWLELAIYNGKYYVSFPPLPSVLMLPLTFVFGENTPNTLTQLVFCDLSTPHGDGKFNVYDDLKAKLIRIHGNIQRMENMFEAFPVRLSACVKALVTLKEQMENAKAEVEKPFAQEQELSEKTARLAELDALLNIDKRESDVIDAETEENLEKHRTVLGPER